MTERTTSHRTLAPFRRTAIVALVAIAATTGAVFGAGSADAADEFVKGSGKAKGTILRIGPSSASLSFAPAVGVSLADHLGTLGRGEALILDYAALDGTVQDDVPNGTDGNIDPKGKQIPPLRVESTQENSAAGREQRALPAVVQRARANTQPYGFSSTELEAFDIPGIIHVGGGRSEAYSGNIEIATSAGKQVVRQAGGAVEIAEVVLGSDTLGKLTLRGLHWEAFQRTDSNDDTTPQIDGSFTFGSMTILDPAGEVQQFAGPTSAQISEGIPQEMKDGLAEFSSQTGIHLLMPELVTTGGVARLTPLRVSLIESPVGQQIFGPIQDGVSPVRNEVTAQWLTNCSEQAGEEDASNCGLPFLVADMAIGPVAGGGRIDIELGGVNGFTEGQIFNNFQFDFSIGGGFEIPPVAAIPVDDFDVPDAPVSVLGEQIEAAVPFVAAPEQGAVDTAVQPAPVPQIFKLTGSRASAAWAVGLVGLGAALTMAATDYRRLRTRRRLITPIS